EGVERLFINTPALPLVAVECLGHTWSHFASWSSPKGSATQLELRFESEDEKLLYSRVRQNGAAHPQSLLAWAIARKWTPSRFFAALRNLTQAGLLVDQNGVLLKNPSL